MNTEPSADRALWSVAVDAPLPTPLTYFAPDGLKDHLQRGQLVSIPLGHRQIKGLLLQALQVPPPAKVGGKSFALKAITAVEQYAPLPEFFLNWLEWLAQYYFHPIGAVASLAFPPLKKTTKERASKRAPVVKTVLEGTVPSLTLEQETVVKNILEKKGFSTHLIFGVTGSGKTEVYMHLLKETLLQGKKGLVLVPEIALTPQLVQRFSARFGNQVAVLHSQLTERERTNQWWEMVHGHKSILIGARSALFCPIENLGMIVVDEEHEASFKQEEKLKYHGRDCAVMLGKFANCPVVLGSATPSLESWKNALEGRYHLHQMKRRVEDRSLPNIEIVDMRAERLESSKQEVHRNPLNQVAEPKTPLPFWLSRQLFTAIEKTLGEKKQVALFLNRRGVAPLVICQACGFTNECPNCDINLTLHGRTHLVCHYCNYHENLKEICPDCKEGEMTPVGLGTELLEKEMRRLLPGATIARADRDEISTRADLEGLIEDMENGKIDILIGTQMIAKGLDFINLNLVGLVLADIGFNIPDFRSTERSFQLVTQVSGRSGRHVKLNESPGQVIVQTFNPEHPSLIFAKNHDFSGFAELELSHRQALIYPPYGRLISVRIQGSDLEKVQLTAQRISRRGQQLKNQITAYEKIEVLGPAQAPLSRVRNQFRYHLLLKGLESKALNQFCRHLLANEDFIPAGVRVAADIDPLHLL